ncbi:MAG: extracellular solute-binding protein, partial [Nocardioidaceae bacterium]
MFPRRRRTRLLGPVLVASALLLASACTSAGDSSPSPAASSSPATASPTGPVTLRFAVYGGAAELAAYRVMAHAYERREPDVTVRVEGVGGAAAERARLDRQFEAGTAPDVFLTPSTALPRLVEDDRVQPVDGLLETRGVQFGDHYERLGLEAFAADSALQCMPDDVSPQVVFYNKRLLTPAVLATLATPEAPQLIPQVNGWTWEQFGTAARRITRPGVKGVYLAPTLETLTPLLRSAGTDIVDDPKRPTTLQLSDGTARSTLESILRLARNPRITLTGAQIASESVLSRFEHNRLGMITGTRALVPVLRAMPGLQFDVYPLPRFDHFATVADVSG